MKEALWPFVTLLSHWRRHPANLATLFVGLAMATALWSGVQALNAQARDSYQRASALFGAGAPPSLVAKSGGYFSQALWLDLRLVGVAVSPVIEGGVHIGGQSMRLVGVEPLTAPRGSQFTNIARGDSLTDFILPPGRAIVAPETLIELGAREGARLNMAHGDLLPPLTARAAAPPGVIFVDIGVAQTLLQKPEQLSRLLVDGRAPTLPPKTPLRLEEPDEENDIARLTDSLHLNLTAFGGLAFLVGLFIVYSASGLAFQQRLPMLRVMLCVGVSHRALVMAMLAELLGITALAAFTGMACGYLIAALLLPDVSASLEGLYGAHMPGRLSLDTIWWFEGIAMALAGALVSAATGFLSVIRLPAIAVARLDASRAALRRTQRWRAIAAAVALTLAAAAIIFDDSLTSAFVATAAMLLGAALLLPLALSLALAFFEPRARTALGQWFWAESRMQLPALSLALAALLLALSTSIGVGAMVSSFRGAFVDWLDLRLNAEVYFEAIDASAAGRIEEWLRTRSEVTAILPLGKARTRLAGWPVEVVATRDHETYRAHFPLISAAPGAWDAMRRGEGVLVNEQLARRLHVEPGAAFDIDTPAGPWRARVVGVFPDYGNARGQLRLDVDILAQHWPEATRTGYSLRVNPGAAEDLVQDMQRRFGADIARIMDQAAVKKLSTNIFEKTFAVTSALNLLTLIVSGVALFTSLSMLIEQRVAQLAPAWAIGVARITLIKLETLRIFAFATAAALAAIPLGVALEWLLVDIVNVRAFGWRLPFNLFPMLWGEALLLAVLAAGIASLLPLMRLARAQPAELLKVFDNES